MNPLIVGLCKVVMCTDWDARNLGPVLTMAKVQFLQDLHRLVSVIKTIPTLKLDAMFGM